MPKNLIKIDLRNAYDEIHSLRRTGRDNRSIEITIPRHIIRRYARKHGILQEKVHEEIQGRILYNDFGLDGIFIEFMRRR